MVVVVVSLREGFSRARMPCCVWSMTSSGDDLRGPERGVCPDDILWNAAFRFPGVPAEGTTVRSELDEPPTNINGSVQEHNIYYLIQTHYIYSS